MIGFEARTNYQIPMINTAHFVTESGEVITIDRDRTEYTCKDPGDGSYHLSMAWWQCYIWDGEAQHYINGFPDNLNCCLTKLELEDDAPPDYYVDVEDYFWDVA